MKAGMKPGIAKCWTFRSSRGDRSYQTLLYADGSTSCDCPGWTRRVAADGSRSCKHTRSVLMGGADREADGMHDSTVPRPAPFPTPAHRVVGFGRLGSRRIQV